MEMGSSVKEESTLNLSWLHNDAGDQAHVDSRLKFLWSENPVFYRLMQQSTDLESVRRWVYNYIADYERKTLNNQFYLDILDRNAARKCIHVLKNIFSKRSEDITGYSALGALIQAAHHHKVVFSIAFVEELRHLFLGMKGNINLGRQVAKESFAKSDSRAAALSRSNSLNVIAEKMRVSIDKYRSGLDTDVVLKREANRERILRLFGADKDEWKDWRWQCRHIIRDWQTLDKIIELTPAEKAAVFRATANGLPFGITPYYLSLMDKEPDREYDHAVRSQVIPPPDYVENVVRGRTLGVDMDFMGEKDTSPVDLITRRYPMIAIVKPHNTCAQICVYCQRNWEITDVLDPKARAPRNMLNTALEWLEANTGLNEVLVTGGDPGIMNERVMAEILGRISRMRHIRRIRIGTRVPVVLPMRITEAYADMLADFAKPGNREIVVMTHFEHPYEITPESMEAVQRLRARKIPVYNQTVFTIENARKFEMVNLRIGLRKIGVDPYYTFNAKGKDETQEYRVPIARLAQEQAEEARLTPGLDRTDEAVFNIPRLGKSYLRAGQDHEVVMVLPNGSRVYEFSPWDQGVHETKPYLYEDVPILDFLAKMSRRGENPADYRSIWYYF